MTIAEQITQHRKVLDSVDSMNLEELRLAVNAVADLFNKHSADVQAKCDAKDFADVDGLEFNEWAHDQEHDLETLYCDLHAAHGNKAYEVNGFSTIDY